MAGAVIKIVDVGQEGEVDIQVEFNPEIDNKSSAHQFVARVVEMLHANQEPSEPASGSPTQSAND